MPELARAAGPRQTRISKYVAYFRFVCVGARMVDDRCSLIRRSSPERCCRMQRVWQVRPTLGSSRGDWHCRCSSVSRTSGAGSRLEATSVAVTPYNDNKYLKEDPDGGGRGDRFLRSGAGARSVSEATQLRMILTRSLMVRLGGRSWGAHWNRLLLLHL